MVLINNTDMLQVLLNLLDSSYGMVSRNNDDWFEIMYRKVNITTVHYYNSVLFTSNLNFCLFKIFYFSRMCCSVHFQWYSFYCFWCFGQCDHDHRCEYKKLYTP